METKFDVTIYTDGSIHVLNENIMVSGYSAIVCAGDEEIVLSGVELDLTSDKMEILGLSQALCYCNVLPKGKRVIIYSDSTYVVNMYRKISNQFIPDANRTYWSFVLDVKNRLLSKGIHVDIQWVRGHSKIYGNERADQEAKKVIDRYLKKWWNVERSYNIKEKVILSAKVRGIIFEALELLERVEKQNLYHLQEYFKNGATVEKPNTERLKYISTWVDKMDVGGWNVRNKEEV